MKKFFLVPLLCLGSINFLFADELLDEFEDEFGDFYSDVDFISIATGAKTSINKAPAIASVITSEQIEKIGATNLDEILELIPGLHVTASTVSRLDPVYSIRGIQTGFNPQVLVLVNGTEFKNSFSGGLPYTFRLPAKNIERVEVIRGPGSALYGADAYSGVINVVLKKHHQTENISVGGRMGSFDSTDFWLHIGKKWGELSFGVAIENQSSGGDSTRLAETDQQSVFDGVFGTNSSLAPSPLQTNYDVFDAHATLAYKGLTFENWWWKQSRGGLGAGGAQAIDTLGYQDVDEYRGKLSYFVDLGDDIKFDSQASYLSTKNDTFFKLFPDGAVLPIGADGNINFSEIAGIVNFSEGYIGNPLSKHQDIRIQSSLDFSGIENHKIRLSVGWFRQELTASEFKNFGPGVIDGSQSMVDGTLTDVTSTPFIYVPNTLRTNRHLVIQDVWNIAQDWELTLGLRFDDFSDFGHTTNPRLALVWEAAHDLTVKALYGSAFRAPSFNEQFLQNNPTAIGNPDIKPETIDTYELGVFYQISFNSKLSANLYSYLADDLIGRAPVSGTTSLRTENLSSQTGKGVELEYQWHSDKWQVNTNFSFQDTQNNELNSQVAFVPQRSAYLGVFYDINDKWGVSLISHWISSRERDKGDIRDNIDDYFLVNMVNTYTINNSLKGKLSIKNLLDDDIYEPSTESISNDYRMQARSIWLELEYNINE